MRYTLEYFSLLEIRKLLVTFFNRPPKKKIISDAQIVLLRI